MDGQMHCGEGPGAVERQTGEDPAEKNGQQASARQPEAIGRQASQRQSESTWQLENTGQPGDVEQTDAAKPDATPVTEHYKFFNHTACEFYPCHDMSAEQLNCLFCYCPLYCLGSSCGGNFTYLGDVKDCSACTVPHRVENYDYLMQQFQRVVEVAKAAGPAGDRTN